MSAAIPSYSKYKKKTKKTGLYIASIVLICISLAFSITGLVSIFFYKRSFDSAVCGAMRFTHDALHGDDNDEVFPKWMGFLKIEAFNDEVHSLLNTIDSVVSTDVSNLKTKNDDYVNLIEAYTNDYSVIEINSPNKNSNDKVKPVFVEMVNDYENNNTHMGTIMFNYMNTGNAMFEVFESIHDNVNQIKMNKENIRRKVNVMESELLKIVPLYISFESTVITNIAKIRNIISNKLYIAALVLFSFSIAVCIFIITFNSYYNCKASGHLKPIKYTVHLFWNILLAVIIIFFTSTCFFGSVLILTRELIPIFHHLVSTEYLNTSPNIFQENAIDSNTISHFNTCLNNPNSSFAESFELSSSQYNQFELLYQNYKEINKHYNTLSQYKSDVSYFQRNDDLFQSYIDDLSLTTNSSEHEENDVAYVLDMMNRLTDISHTNAIQVTCNYGGTYDHWVTNDKKCPNGYTYSKTGNNIKNCLKLSEWEINSVKLHYAGKLCPSVNGNPIENEVNGYFEQLKNYEFEINSKINTIIERNSYLKKQYLEIIDLLEDHYKQNEQFLNSFTKVFRSHITNNTNDTSTYGMFNCSILRNDIIALYDNIYGRFYSFSLLDIFSFACSGLFAYVGVYIIIRSLYRASNNELEVDHLNSSSSSGSSSVKSGEEKQGEENGKNLQTNDEKLEKVVMNKKGKGNKYQKEKRNEVRDEDAPQNVEENLREHIRRTYRFSMRDIDNEDVNEDNETEGSNEGETQNNLNRRIRREYVRNNA